MPAALPIIATTLLSGAASAGASAIVGNQNRIAGERAATKQREQQDAVVPENEAKQKQIEDDAAKLETETENQRQARLRQKAAPGSNRASTILGSDTSGTMLGGGGTGADMSGGKTLLGA